MTLPFNKDELLAAIDKHFPYKTFNPGQKEAIAFAAINLAAGKKHVILELPTGIGKSIVATTLHRVLREIYDKKWRTAIITATKGLQDQYLMEDKKIISIKGSTNYSCAHHGNSVSYGTTECKKLIFSGKCNPKLSCDYVKTRDVWLRLAPLRMTNTAYQVRSPASFIGVPDESRVNLTIIDECHSLDQVIVDSASLEVRLEDSQKASSNSDFSTLNAYGKFIEAMSRLEVGKTYDYKVDAEFTSVLDTYFQDLDRVMCEAEEALLKANAAGKSAEADSISLFIESFAGLHSQLSNVKSGSTWIFEKYEYTQYVQLVPLFANQVSEYAIFSKSDQFVHMSATICGAKEYMKTLGVNPDEAVYLSKPNPIPIENRKVYALNSVKVSGNVDYASLTKVVDSIIEKHAITGNQNGVIHTVSFALANSIVDASKYKKAMTVSNTRQDILNTLKRKTGVVVLSPSIETGYDFKGDMSRFQIIAKVPFEYLGSHYVAENMRRSPKWYARRAVLRIVQACGRSVRGVDDWATTYVLDSNFTRLYDENQDLFPDWFKEAVVFV